MAKVKNLSILIATMVWKPWSPPGGGETRYYPKKVHDNTILQDICQTYRLDALKPEERDWFLQQIECVRGNPDLFGPLSGKPHD